MFKGPTAIAFSRDPVAAAKVAVEYANKNEKLTDRRRQPGRAHARPGWRQGPGDPAVAREMRAQLLGLIDAPATRSGDAFSRRRPASSRASSTPMPRSRAEAAEPDPINL